MAAGGGTQSFASAEDLRSYTGLLFARVLSFAYVASDFVEAQLLKSHPGSPLKFSPGIILPASKFDPSHAHDQPIVPLNAVVATFPDKDLEALTYFLG